MSEFNFGKKLRRLRRDNDLTQSQVASYLTISTQTISKYENNINEPSIESLRKLAKLFDVTLDELLGAEAPQHRLYQID